MILLGLISSLRWLFATNQSCVSWSHWTLLKHWALIVIFSFWISILFPHIAVLLSLCICESSFVVPSCRRLAGSQLSQLSPLLTLVWPLSISLCCLNLVSPFPQIPAELRKQVGIPRTVLLFIVHSLSRIWLFVTLWTAARQTSLSITNSWSLLRLTSIESVMPSNHLILCCPHLLLHSIFPNIKQGLFQWVGSSHQVAKVLELQHQSFV